ncbi:MAG: (E)-4-hydroxy-3-methylbut-2-enyl-diphosphate synthase [Verrucomicrobiae bacterium]|nr:(E)-4-hydroxy-3-methylbut-2-enyl-diphosphate synthase [Verrucomicrobiae bacterium]
MKPYCSSRFLTVRRKSREVTVGNVGVGGSQPIRIQSMTTTVTTDVEATVKQARALVEAGCEIVRITAPNNKSAQALAEISKILRQDKINVPLVADIHFLPSAAMEAAEHVEKIRVNPGNYADKKKFQIREYSDAEYNLELERLHEAFSPLVLKCKRLGRSMRIGTNHGSLSDRIMNRFGDSPMGMVESALEFVRIAESHGYYDIILSLKASNPKVMIQAYRLSAARMEEEGMDYPLHLGVTEAGDGEDGRIKSAIGIGSLLMDGLGDTIRVSLTEDPVFEIPVAKALAEKTSKLWQSPVTPSPGNVELLDPYVFVRREIETVELTPSIQLSSSLPPRVFLKPGNCDSVNESLNQLKDLRNWNSNEETVVEGWVLEPKSSQDLKFIEEQISQEEEPDTQWVLDLDESLVGEPNKMTSLSAKAPHLLPSLKWDSLKPGKFEEWCKWCIQHKRPLALGMHSGELARNAGIFLNTDLPPLIFFAERAYENLHILGEYRLLASVLGNMGLKAPLWIRCRENDFIESLPGFLNGLLEVSLLAGGLLSDGIGDILSVESVADPRKALTLAYNALQGAGARISKTEYVACPSCGRTLFDLQQTTQKIRLATDHLKGVKIAVMGCIVNGPGEMADADFGYVGGAPGKVNLYIGKDCVEYHVPERNAVNRLVELIQREGKWVEPKVEAIR